MTRTLALTLAALLAACSGGSDSQARQRLEAGADTSRAGQAAVDPSKPRQALALTADEVAARLGSFEWSAAIDWTVAREGDEPAPPPPPPPARAEDGKPAPFVPPPPPPPRVHALERHRLRQSATGEFHVEADVDPGLGPGSDTGKEIVYAGGMTYARARYAPFRERPTDRGRDARRFRDESFRVAHALAALYGDALALEPAGESTVAGRSARRFRLSLAPGAPQAAAKPRVLPTGAPDPDSAARFAFLDARVPESAEGELLLDAATGAPLRVRLAGSFTVKDAPGVRARVELLAQVTALGEKAAPIAAPSAPLPDVRKPPGVAGALEAAGLKKKAEAEAGASEPVDDEP